MSCRHCQAPLQHVFLDLAYAPPSNAYLSAGQLKRPELTFPLKLYVCDQCWLVQTEDYAEAEQLFCTDYAYFSSTSKGWLQHAADYTSYISERLSLNGDSFVVEVASNDGYLLKNFVEAGVPCLGIEPTDSTADAAEKIGVPVRRDFFGEGLARQLQEEGVAADLICGNNVYAHVPDINDFTRGLGVALKQDGVINLEFPHLMRLIDQSQFDTVYHEHFSYLSLLAVSRIFREAGLRIFDVEELGTHGGSLRIFACHLEACHEEMPSVQNMLDKEISYGLSSVELYLKFQEKANNVKNNFVGFLLEQHKAGKTVAAYGAAAKGNTLMNYAGVRPDLIEFVCDAAPSKQGKYMPGSHLPILHPEEITSRKPDWVVILPWNISSEVMAQQKIISSWGGQFVVAVPELKVLS